MNGKIRIAVAFTVVAFASVGLMAATAEAAVKPANLMVSVDTGGGSLKPLGNDRFLLRAKAGPRKLAVRSIEKKGLLGARHVSYRQRTFGYLSTWRSTFAGEHRHAVITVPGKPGGALPVKLKRPRFDSRRNIVSFVVLAKPKMAAAFGAFRGRKVKSLPRSFRDSNLKINENGWYQLIAHMDAYNELGHCGSSGYEGPDFQCTGKGQAYATLPFRDFVGFGSTEGGVKFWATGSADLPTPDWSSKHSASARLVGTQGWGWRGDVLTITSESYYQQDWGGCRRYLSGGTDASLNGKPGGTVHVNLYENGSSWSNKGYTLELNGYLSEPFFTTTSCDS